jgi:branched-chain amino acid transport system substrate-binding protein
VLAPSVQGARIVAALRSAGFGGTIVGGAALGRAAFARAAGPAAEGVLAPKDVAEAGQAWAAFAAAYRERWGGPPDGAAAHGYDAVRLVVAAVRRAGLNRALIRDAVRTLAPWSGASGTVVWDTLGRNTCPASLGPWQDGRLVVSSR